MKEQVLPAAARVASPKNDAVYGTYVHFDWKKSNEICFIQDLYTYIVL